MYPLQKKVEMCGPASIGVELERPIYYSLMQTLNYVQTDMKKSCA